MREFDWFLNEGKVKKIGIDVELANSLIKNVEARETSVSKLQIDEFPMIVFENFYDCLREILGAILALSGYKSYSHEAPISYLKNLNFPDDCIFEMDRFRRKRNNSKYYGKSPTSDEAKEIKSFYLEKKQKLFEIISNLR